MVKGGWKRHESADESEVDYRFVHTNSDLAGIIQTAPLREEILIQRMRYYGHVCRRNNSSLTKKMMFAQSKRPYYRDLWNDIASEVGIEINQLL